VTDAQISKRRLALLERALENGMEPALADELADAAAALFVAPSTRPWTIDPPTPEGLARLRAVASAEPRQPIPYEPDPYGESEECAICDAATLFWTALPDRAAGEQVAICSKCATTRSPADVPTKQAWFARAVPGFESLAPAARR
jgi:hypothetical protein